VGGCWCICEPMYRGPSRGPCIGSIYPTLLGFGGINQLFSPNTLKPWVGRRVVEITDSGGASRRHEAGGRTRQSEGRSLG